jgi:mono/diheme cytochrome c family protein
MKKATKILIGLMIVAFTVTSAFAAIEKPDNYKKGKYLYKKNCKTCHVKSASDKTMGQWERIYKKGEHRGGAEAWEKLDEKELHQIFFYLYEHARDSAQPETCG